MNSLYKRSKAALIMALIVLLVSGCSKQESSPQGAGAWGSRQANIPAVETVRAIVGSLPLEERVTGRVTARNQTEIYPEVGGPIREIYVENGDFVEAGDPLVKLRDSEFAERYQQALSGLAIAEAQSRQARASLDLARSQLSRMQTLVDRNLETTANLDTAVSQVDIAEADLDLRIAQENQARSLLEERLLQVQNATIRAPISGTVGQRNAEVGQLATTTSRLFVIGDLTEVRVEVLLSERMLNYIEEGESVNIFSDNWNDRVLSSAITRISPFLDPATMRTAAFIEMSNDSKLLRPGMFVTVDILYGESEQAVLIPNSALYHHPRTGLEGVYVISKPDLQASPLQQEGEGLGIIAPAQPVEFVSVDIIASGRMASAVRGIEEGDLVITIGQNLLEGGVEQARPRLLPWDYMMELQELQSEDMFEFIDQSRQALSSNS